MAVNYTSSASLDWLRSIPHFDYGFKQFTMSPQT
jgi:hypothetical protein